VVPWEVAVSYTAAQVEVNVPFLGGARTFHSKRMHAGLLAVGALLLASSAAVHAQTYVFGRAVFSRHRGLPVVYDRDPLSPVHLAFEYDSTCKKQSY